MNQSNSGFEVLNAFGFDPAGVELRPVVRQGFSDARVWKVVRGEVAYCLRNWGDSHVTSQRLDWLHAQLRLAEECEFVPVPFVWPSGEPYWFGAGGYWELTPWMPGQADFNWEPSYVKLHAAIESVVRLHRCWSDSATRMAPSLAARERVALLRKLPDRLLQLEVARYDWSDAHRLCVKEVSVQAIRRMISPLLREGVVHEQVARPVQTVVRDLWHDHLLFDGERLGGLVDFGTMQIDARECDWARMLGSLRVEGQVPWTWAKQIFAALPEAPAVDWTYVQWLHATGSILGWMNWIDWLFHERRHFANRAAAIERLKLLGEQIEMCEPIWGESKRLILE